ncbi:MAG: tRNA threonylcarbamoyladenosine dehydratase [Spirochaetes bacterium]|nr:tRNA threonylcarbamoyladenosine dehydratase [Spirochaetota bacterium]
MDNFYETMTDRTRMVIGGTALGKLRTARIILFGVGGVGSWCAEALVRTGCADLTIVDPDVVCATNINRQVEATAKNIGAPKVMEMEARLRDINPSASITARSDAYGEASRHGYDLGSYDYVIDAIDSVNDKVLLIEDALSARVMLFSSMGAAAKTDPTMVRVALLSKTRNCPLARTVRRRLRERNCANDFICVYSEELPVGGSVEASAVTGGIDPEGCGKKKRTSGSLVHVTGVFGLTLAGLVINDIAGGQAG